MTQAAGLASAMLLLAIAAPVTAAGSLLVAEGIDSDGNTRVQGDLAAFATSDLDEPTGSPFGSMSLQATKIRVEVDWIEYAVRAAGSSSAGDQHDTEQTTHLNATVTTTEARASSFAFVMPQARGQAPIAEASYTSTTVRSTDGSSITSYERVQAGRGPLQARVQDALQATSAQAYDVRVEGDFVLSLWDMDLSIRSDQGATQVWTGERAGDLGPVPGTAAVDSVRMQQAYLFVEDGVLDLRVDRFTGSLLYMAGKHMEADGTWLRGATGTIHTTEGPRDVLGEDIRLSVVRLDVGQATAQGLPVRIADSDGAWIDGESVDLRYAAPSTPGILIWPWLLAAIVVLVAAWPLVRALRRATTTSGAGRRGDEWRDVQVAMEAGDHERVLQAAPKLLTSENGADAALMLGTLFLKEDRATEALDVLNGPSTWRIDQLGPRAYLEAVAYALLGHMGLARHRLEEGMYHEPGVREKARSHALLKGLLVVEELTDRDVA